MHAPDQIANLFKGQKPMNHAQRQAFFQAWAPRAVIARDVDAACSIVDLRLSEMQPSDDPLPPHHWDEDPLLTPKGRDFLFRLVLNDRLSDHAVPGEVASYRKAMHPTAEQNARIDRLAAEGAFTHVFSGFPAGDKPASS